MGVNIKKRNTSSKGKGGYSFCNINNKVSEILNFETYALTVSGYKIYPRHGKLACGCSDYSE